jgi:hypothetical protein
MYSLTIHFGPNAVAWALLFKEEEKAGVVYNAYVGNMLNGAEAALLIGVDDFGQSFAIPFNDIHGIMLEDLDLVEEARIQRSLANARGEVKARQRASTDPVIRQAQTGAPILTPMGGFRPQ